VTELADIFRDAGPAYVQRFGDRLLPSHRRVLRDIVDCRTPVLGGQMFLCHVCAREHAVYHSCRNRHCPKCQGDRAEEWLARQRDLLLPCDYGLATCTLPPGLRDIARSHQRTVYSILMAEAAHALLELVANRRFIGGLTGIMAVLHTWTRALTFHPHVHMLFPVGGLTDDAEAWVKPRRRSYILPGYALARRFRERVEIAFRKAGLYDLVPRHVWRQRWVANVKRVGTGETALLYLSRYVFRVAISNQRILAFDGRRVTFSARSRDGETTRHTVDAHELIRRFLLHVLPGHFVKVRYYGLWAPTNRDKLALARAILQHHLDAIGKTPRPRPANDQNLTADRRPRCPHCGSPYRDPPRHIPRSRAPP
jgi:hypothetical protein